MPLHLAHNPYQGINVHHHSFLLNDAQNGNWKTFHNDYIGEIKKYLNSILPPQYFAVSEQSIQIQRLDQSKAYPSFPDVAIFRQKTAPAPLLSGAVTTAAPVLSIAAEAAWPEADPDLNGVVVYELKGGGLAEPILRIELLSPSNLDRHWEGYRRMRRQSLEGGLHLLEINYLHQYSSPFAQVFPDYSRHLPGAYPFYMALSNPHEQKTDFYAWHVDETIPLLSLPLAEFEWLAADFGSPYADYLQGDRRAAVFIDYELPPLAFDTYQDFDQARILALMARLKAEDSNRMSL